MAPRYDDLYGLREQIKENIRLIIGPSKHGDHFKASSFLITTSYDEESYTAIIHLYAGGGDRTVMSGYPTASVAEALRSLLEISSRVVSLMRDARAGLQRVSSDRWGDGVGNQTAYPPGSWIDIALRFSPVPAALEARLEAGIVRPVEDYGIVTSFERHQARRREGAGSLRGSGVWWQRHDGAPAAGNHGVAL